MKARIVELGGTVLAGSPADFGKLIADDTEKWAKVIRAAGSLQATIRVPTERALAVHPEPDG
jgi:hypothetical protein